MKQTNFFKKTLLLLALLAGVSTTWADDVAVTVNNDSELKTAYETAYNSEVAGTTVITMNAGTYTCEGMAHKQLQMPKVRSVTLQAAEGAKVTLNTKVVSDGGGTPTGSLTFKGIFITSSYDTFINIASCGNVDHISFIDCDITGDASTHRFLIKNGNASYTLNTISFNGCVIHDMGNGYYWINPTHKVQNVSFTNSTIYNYNGDQLFLPVTASSDVFTFVFNNNTVYKCGASGKNTSVLYVDNKYNNADNTFTFKDNIFWDKYGTGEGAAYVFYSKTGAGTVTQKNNVLHSYTAEWNTGTYTKDYSNLDYTGSIPFYDAENHNFGIHPSHALATASTTGGVVGDPRWLIINLDETGSYTPKNQNYAVVTLTRSISAGNWSTLCLPFDIASGDIETVFGAGTIVAELTGGTESTLIFTTTLTDSKMKANQPYAIKVASDFTDATIDNVNIVNAAAEQTAGDWQFVGTYAAGTIPADSYFFSSNKLYKASGSGNSIKPFRAYFTYNGAGAARDLNFIIDGETTSVRSIDNGQLTIDNYYDLQGRKVTQPTKGLYIVNGRKVVVK